MMSAPNTFEDALYSNVPVTLCIIGDILSATAIGLHTCKDEFILTEEALDANGNPIEEW